MSRKPHSSVARELAAVGRYLGYEPGHIGDILDDYRQVTRRARAVIEDRFCGGVEGPRTTYRFGVR